MEEPSSGATGGPSGKAECLDLPLAPVTLEQQEVLLGGPLEEEARLFGGPTGGLETPELRGIRHRIGLEQQRQRGALASAGDLLPATIVEGPPALAEDASQLLGQLGTITLMLHLLLEETHVTLELAEARLRHPRSERGQVSLGQQAKEVLGHRRGIRLVNRRCRVVVGTGRKQRRGEDKGAEEHDGGVETAGNHGEIVAEGIYARASGAAARHETRRRAYAGGVSRYPENRWRYYAHIQIGGTDRYNLPDCLEAEELACFAFLPRSELYEQIREGTIELSASATEPFVPFASDLAVFSVYLFQIIRGIEVLERHIGPDEMDDVRAWKIVARQGEWVKFPLRVTRDAEGRFHVDEDAHDLDVIRARWQDYPRWFHDGMRRQHPLLRDL